MVEFLAPVRHLDGVNGIHPARIEWLEVLHATSLLIALFLLLQVEKVDFSGSAHPYGSHMCLCWMALLTGGPELGQFATIPTWPLSISRREEPAHVLRTIHSV